MLVIAKANLKSISPYSQSKMHMEPKMSEESNDDYDRRTWRSHLHVLDNGNVGIPPTGCKQALEAAAAFLGMKIPERRGATFTKRFLSGILIVDPIDIGIKADSVPPERVPVNPEGKRGGQKRVWRTYPTMTKWEGTLVVNVFDAAITQEVLQQHIEAAGRFVGLGRYRPQNGGYYGRFEVMGEIKWEVLKDKE